jgi:hypothetical protein
MARDYEDIFDTDDLDNDELRRLVRDTLRDNRSIDATDISVHVHEGQIMLAGRVGTDAEKRIAERVIEDRLGLDNVQSQLVVDPLRRAKTPEAADEQQAAEGGEELLPMGDRVYRDYDTIQRRSPDSDTEGDLDDTTESTESTELGIPWTPPLSQTPEGVSGPDVKRNSDRDSY